MQKTVKEKQVKPHTQKELSCKLSGNLNYKHITVAMAETFSMKMITSENHGHLITIATAYSIATNVLPSNC